MLNSGRQRRSATPPTVAQTIYTALKEEILWGRIESETLLSETALAGRFGVSRMPVREALAMLASDGLVVTLPRRGHLVRTVSLTEVLDAFRVREILEVESVAQAVHRIGEKDLARLRELIDIRATPDLPAVNREFHLTIARASGNRILAEFLEELLASMQRVLIEAPQTVAWFAEVAEEESAIVDALEARDEAAAEEAMRRHIRNTLTSVLGKGRGILGLEGK